MCHNMKWSCCEPDDGRGKFITVHGELVFLDFKSVDDFMIYNSIDFILSVSFEVNVSVRFYIVLFKFLITKYMVSLTS